VSNLYDIDLEQDVWMAWDPVKRKAYFTANGSDPNATLKMHSKGDKHLAIEQYKADLDESGVKYKIAATIPTGVFKDMLTRWRQAMENLGHKWPFSKLSAAEQKQGWDAVIAKLQAEDNAKQQDLDNMAEQCHPHAGDDPLND
jgi:hypothetical protein